MGIDISGNMRGPWATRDGDGNQVIVNSPESEARAIGGLRKLIDEAEKTLSKTSNQKEPAR